MFRYTKALALTISALVMLLVPISWQRQSIPDLPLSLIPNLAPGRPMPTHGVVCSWNLPDDSLTYCEAITEQHREVSFAYDRSKREIASVSYLILGDFTIGQLILHWGIPTGYTRNSNAVTVYWPSRYAYIVSRVFSPSSPVGFISFTNQPLQPASAWAGFKAR
jgi:hypothetical protein